MNVKKMFAATAGMLIVASSLPVSVLGAASYSDELQGAYNYAYSKGITTMSSIDNANMYGELTRGQLAKMISNWAEKELGTKADETKVCSFADAQTAEGDLAAYVKKACQMGLMGQGITSFRPNDKVTRGEFGTTLSRAIWGTKYDGATPYYANHLQALKDKGIMTKIENPSQMEIRGYVMLMLQRTTDVEKGAKCNDPVTVLACTMGAASCPAECKKTVTTGDNNQFSGVRAGDLSIALNSTNGTTSIPNDGVIKVAELNINASQDIQLQSLNVTRLGLSQNQGLKVWIEKDGRRITSSSSFFGDSKANLVFNGGYVVKKGEKLDLVISLDKSKVQAGSELSFKLSDVTSSAMNTTVSPDTTGVYRTTNYSVTSLSFLPMTNADRNYNISKDSSFSFGEFKLQNDSPASMEKNVLIKNITFKVEGADINNLKDFKLLRNGKELKTTYLVNGRDVTLTINDQLDSGKSAVYKVVATPTNIENADGDGYTFVIRRAEDVIAEELGQNSVGYRVAIKTLNNVDLKKTTIKGGTITLTRDANFPSVVNADWGYSDVTIAKGTIKLNQSTKFEGGVELLKAAGSNDLTGAVRRAALTIGGRTYQATSIEAGKIKFDSEVYLEKGTHNIELTVSIPSTQFAGVDKFELQNISNASFLRGAYLNSDETAFRSNHMVGTVRVARVNIQAQKISFKKVGPNEDVRIVKGNTDEKVIFAGEITNAGNKTLEISQIALTGADGTVTGGVKLADVSLHLADGSTSSTVAINKGGVASIDSITTTIEPGKTLKFELRAINNADIVAPNSYRFDVMAKGTLEGNTVTTTILKSAYVRVTSSATTTVVGNTSAKNSIVLPGAPREIASFNYNVKNDSTDIDSVTFSGAHFGANDFDNMSIRFGDIEASVESTTVDTTNGNIKVKFANLITLPAKNYNVKVMATFSESAVNGTKREITKVRIDNNGVDMGSGTLSYGHYIAKAYPIISVKEKNTNSGNERLDLNVLKNSDDHKVVLVKIMATDSTHATPTDTLFNKVSGSAGAFTNVELSKDNVEVARATGAKTAVKTVSFDVTDDYGNTVNYVDVDASNIADFASLSL